MEYTTSRLHASCACSCEAAKASARPRIILSPSLHSIPPARCSFSAPTSRTLSPSRERGGHCGGRSSPRTSLFLSCHESLQELLRPAVGNPLRLLRIEPPCIHGRQEGIESLVHPVAGCLSRAGGGLEICADLRPAVLREVIAQFNLLRRECIICHGPCDPCVLPANGARQTQQSRSRFLERDSLAIDCANTIMLIVL